MNKYLMLSAAALFASSSSSFAAKGSGSVHLTACSDSGGCYCDVYTVNWSGRSYADQVDWTPCGISSHSYGMGIVSAKKKNSTVAISDNYKGDINAGFMVSWQFGIPFANGKIFDSYYTTDGVHVILYAEGAYYISKAPAHPSKISTIDALPKRMIKRRGFKNESNSEQRP